MSNQFIPTSSVEYEVLSLDTLWGDSAIEYSPYIIKDETPTKLETKYWKILNFLTRDFRLGNISPRLHDINFLWSYTSNAGQILLLRNGAFEEVFIAMVLPVATTLETSQSIGGFFRKVKQTIHHEQRYEDTTPSTGFFGRKKKRSDY